MSEKDKPRIQWSATEIVGIGIDNPERVRKTEDGKTVLMPTTFPQPRHRAWLENVWCWDSEFIGTYPLAQDFSELQDPEMPALIPADGMVEGREMKVVHEITAKEDKDDGK